MPMYYLCTDCDLYGDHLVHKEGCPKMPQGVKWLGNYDTCAFPVQRAREKYPTAFGCPACAPDCSRNKILGIG